MWISKKKWELLERRVADLERKVQNQPEQSSEAIANHLKEILLKQTLPQPFDDSLKNRLQ